MMRWLLSILPILIVSVAMQIDTTFHSLQAAKKDPIVVEHLILQKKKYSKMPDSLFIFENLLTLDLSRNKIDLLSADIGEISTLRKLDLSRNKINILPPQIGKLENLQELILSKNQIKELPEQIGQLQNLEKLILDGNQITKIPTFLYKMPNLKLIDLRQLELEDKDLLRLHDELPETAIYYSTNCPCGF